MSTPTSDHHFKAKNSAHYNGDITVVVVMKCQHYSA